MMSYPGPPMTLGSAAGRIWCSSSAATRLEPDPAEMAARYGAETTVPDWGKRLV
jgi:hypothetical protein